MKSGRLDVLVSPRRHAPMLARRRATTIAWLARGLALLLAGLTLAWVAIDFAVFEPALARRLAVVRLAATAAFAGLWLLRPRAAPPLGSAYARLLALFAIPALFHVTTQEILRGEQIEGFARGIAAAYALVPYAMAAGIAAFPLVALESAALALLPLALLAWTTLRDARFVDDALVLDAFWLLFLIVGACAFAAMSQVRLLAALIRQATRDPLTGCLRRESGAELLDAHFLLSTRRGTPLTVAFADLDRFKAVNDAWGHEVGDTVLANASRSLREAARESDVVLRWGGEEFAVVLPETDARAAMRLVERLRERGAGRLPDGRAVTLSIGIAERIADAATTSAALVDLADQRMYLAKQAGRNRCVLAADGEAQVIFDAS